MTIPDIGPLIAAAIAVLAPPPATFRRARDFAAWLGLVPRQHSTGGKQRLGATTKMRERSLRRLLILGANSVIIKRQVHASARPGTWLGGMLTRKPPMLVRVALANKMARIVWALMTKGVNRRRKLTLDRRPNLTPSAPRDQGLSRRNGQGVEAAQALIGMWS